MMELFRHPKFTLQTIINQEKMKTMKVFFRLMVLIMLIGSINPIDAQVSKASVPMLKLNNGLEMPQLGIGTFAISYEDAKQACLEAFRNGFRHVDCATAYRVEGAVGEAMKESGIPREEFFISSKLWVSDYANGKTLASIDTILKRFQTDYIDLLYIHQPIGDYVNAWKEMEKAVASGKVRSLGISNFDASKERFHAIVDHMKVKPVALQIECHPYAQRNDIREWVKPYDIYIECWYPLGHGDKGLLSDPVIKTIADAHGKSIAQIILRWHIQEGFSVIPGATNPVHIKENISIFDFELSETEMKTMRSLNKDKRFFNVTLEQLDSWANRANR
jgi:diketogulonate reductase-like aldo/keto reductase